jgi:hypothetical protein
MINTFGISFSLQLMIGRNKLECLTLANISIHVKYNTLTYCAHSQVTKEIECCKYTPAGTCIIKLATAVILSVV